MSEITNISELKEAIRVKEMALTDEGRALKADFHSVYESLKPINLLKNTIRHAMDSKEVQSDLITSGISLAAGVIAKKLRHEEPAKPKGTLWERLLKVTMEGIEKNPDMVKSVGSQIIDAIFNRKKSDTSSK